MQGKTLVEIGCGRGGGLNYVVQELKPEKTFGIDISEANIQFCKKTFDT
jgi:cyclopropane fatty-acyl-phospholipid synthase-like methyltransferase